MNIKIHCPRPSTHFSTISTTWHRTADPTRVLESSTRPQSIAAEALGPYIERIKLVTCSLWVLIATCSTYHIQYQKEHNLHRMRHSSPLSCLRKLLKFPRGLDWRCRTSNRWKFYSDARIKSGMYKFISYFCLEVAYKASAKLA
jgi:hypothetical protein